MTTRQYGSRDATSESVFRETYEKPGRDAAIRATWGEVLALPENRAAAVRDQQIDAIERQEELLANIYDGEPEFLIAAMQADVVVARTVMKIIGLAHADERGPDDHFILTPSDLSRRLNAALLEYVERAA